MASISSTDNEIGTYRPALIAPLGAVWAVVYVAPLLLLLAASFLRIRRTSIDFSTVTLENYRTFLTDPFYVGVLLRTASSIEVSVVQFYDRILNDDKLLDPKHRPWASAFRDNHAANAATYEQMTADAGAEPWPCSNPRIDDFVIGKVMGLVEGSPKTEDAPAVPATDDDWATEYLSLDIAVRVVDDLDTALEHIRTWSSGHTEVICTRDLGSADRFVAEVDSAAVMVNASSRFTDGGQLGLGAEIGISTQKLHARGPMGLAELTTTKWVVHGDGHVRP